jgi:hypothetical protein
VEFPTDPLETSAPFTIIVAPGATSGTVTIPELVLGAVGTTAPPKAVGLVPALEPLQPTLTKTKATRTKTVAWFLAPNGTTSLSAVSAIKNFAVAISRFCA